MTGIERSIRIARQSLAAAAALALAAGCGGDFTGAGDALRDAEAGDLATLMARQTSRVMLAQAEEAPSPGGTVPVSSELIFDRGAACPRGGSAAVTGRVASSSTVEEDLLTLDFRASLVHDSCEVRLGDRSVTLVGAPAVGLDAVFERRGDRLSGPQEARLNGQIRWTAAGGVGAACQVELTTTLSVEQKSLAASGRVCGVAVDRTVSVDPTLETDRRPGRSAAAPAAEKS